MISVQQSDFDLGEEYRLLRSAAPEIGAIVTFVGLVRDFGDESLVKGMYLEHYPGMTERVLQEIIDEAKNRWPVKDVRIIHRVGNLSAADQIVFVGVNSKHREAAFAACEFLMDFLKTRAPFWKKEITDQGEYWVEAKDVDTQRADRWKDSQK